MSTDKNNEELPEELKSLEAALRGLTPSAGKLDRDRLMYLAGQVSPMRAFPPGSTTGLARWQTNAIRNLWPLATAALALICVGLGGLLLRSTRPAEPLVLVVSGGVTGGNQPSVVPLAPSNNFSFVTSRPPEGANYMQLRNLILTRGIDALQESSVTVRPSTPQPALPMLPALRHELLGPES
jgi:hypothetical protein